MACEYTKQCPFFNERVDVKKETLAMYKARYCRDNHMDCARFLVATALGRPAVPMDLHPTDKLRALKMLRAYDKESHPEQSTIPN